MHGHASAARRCRSPARRRPPARRPTTDRNHLDARGSCPCLRGGPPSCSQWKMADLRYQSVKHKGLAIRLACDAAKSLVVRALPEKAALAQLVEHIIRNDGVACSSHASGTISPLRAKGLMAAGAIC